MSTPGEGLDAVVNKLDYTFIDIPDLIDGEHGSLLEKLILDRTLAYGDGFSSQLTPTTPYRSQNPSTRHLHTLSTLNQRQMQPVYTTQAKHNHQYQTVASQQHTGSNCSK